MKKDVDDNPDVHSVFDKGKTQLARNPFVLLYSLQTQIRSDLSFSCQGALLDYAAYAFAIDACVEMDSLQYRLIFYLQ